MNVWWDQGPLDPTLSDDEVHVWCAFLDLPTEVLRHRWATLSADEVARAERFILPRHREQFVAARGWLRSILSLYVGTAPGQLRFRYGERGKPALAPEFGAGGVRFNLSHSRDWALIAVTSGREVGVDVEYVDHATECERLAEQFFSALERDALCALPVHLRREAFFRCWTRKEAYVKALGEGLSHPLADFEVTLAPGVLARLLATRRDPAEATRWGIVDLTPQPGYAGALVVEAGTGWRLRRFRLDTADLVPGRSGRPARESGGDAVSDAGDAFSLTGAAPKATQG